VSKQMAGFGECKILCLCGLLNISLVSLNIHKYSGEFRQYSVSVA